MASRRRAREYALQALYRADLRGSQLSAAMNDLWSGLMDAEGIEEGRPPESEEVEFAQRLALGVEANRAGIDTLIEGASTNWRLARMPVVDRSILRIAAFELMECPDIPATVSINEAVELAKRFGGTDSRAFVNGIVDRMARQLGRVEGRRRRKEQKLSLDRIAASWWFGDAVLFAMCAGVVGVALLMTPSAEVVSLFGFEMPIACTWRRLTGIGCPGCGLTRSFAFMAELRLAEAWSMNWLGPPMFAVVAAQLPYRAWRLVARARTEVPEAAIPSAPESR